MSDLGHSANDVPESPSGWWPRAEHVWVEGVGVTRCPGILMGWRTKAGRPDAWEGWVVYAAPGGDDGDATLRQMWLDASHIVAL